MIKILESNINYKNEVSSYGKKDGLLALGLFAIVILSYSILGLMRNNITFINDNIILFGCIFNFILPIVTIGFVKFKKQSLSSVGLYKGKWKISCACGIVLACIYFFDNCISNLMNGASLISGKSIAIYVVYYLLVAVCEEIVFRGYISTRIYGLIHNRWLAIVFSGLLFVLMHFPYRLIAYGMSFYDLTIT